MRRAESGGCAIAALAKLVLKKQRVSWRHTNAAARVDRLGPGVARQISQSAAEPPLELRGKGVVIGLSDSGNLEYTPELRPRRSGRDAADRARIGRVEVTV